MSDRWGSFGAYKGKYQIRFTNMAAAIVLKPIFNPPMIYLSSSYDYT